jgi:hypothetical protein
MIKKDTTSLRQAQREGTLSKQDIRGLKQSMKESPLVYGFKHSGLNINQAFNVYEKGTPEEKKVLLPLLKAKYNRARENARVVDRVDMTNRYKEVTGGPR